MPDRCNVQDAAGLRAFLAAHELECYHILSNLDAFGVENDGDSLRCGDYFVTRAGDAIRGVMAVYNDQNAYVYAPCADDAADFARALAGYKLKVLQGSPCETVRAIHDLACANMPVIEPRECTIAFMDPPPATHAEGLAMVRLDPARADGFDDAAAIYNEAQDECMTGETLRKIAGEMRGGEGVYLITWRGEPCGTISVIAESPTYQCQGALGVRKDRRKLGAATFAADYLHRRAAARGRIVTVCVGLDNVASLRVLEKLGAHLGKASYQFYWYY